MDALNALDDPDRTVRSWVTIALERLATTAAQP